MPMRKSSIRFLVGLCAIALLTGSIVGAQPAFGWPAASLQSRDRDCTGCHTAANSWTDTSKVIVDMVDMKTGKSLRMPDGTFEVVVPRGSELRVNSIFGVKPGYKFPPEMVGWLYVSPEALESAPESDPKFAPGWQVNRSFCMKRLVETIDGYPGNQLAAVPMTVRPLEGAGDATISLQVLLKSSGRGLPGDYIERTVRLRVAE